MCGLSQKRFWLNGCARVVRGLSAQVLVWTLIISAMVEATFAQECRQWQQVAINGRYGNRLAFDSNRNVTVLFGGIAPTSYGGSFGDTWEFDGKNWTLRTTKGPPPRMSQGMTFDSKRNVVVMFGGYCYAYSGGGCTQTNMNDTWEWDGKVWTLRAIEGPSPRASVGLAYDSEPWRHGPVWWRIAGVRRTYVFQRHMGVGWQHVETSVVDRTIAAR